MPFLRGVLSARGDPRRPGYSGWGGVLFVCSQGFVPTAKYGLPLFAVAIALGVLRGAFDFGARPTRTEWAWLAFASAWLLTSWAGLDASRSHSLSMPLWSASLLIVAIGREPDARAALASMLLALAALSAVWSVQLLELMLASNGIDPIEAVKRGGGTLLVVPNDFSFIVVMWPLWWHIAASSPHRIARVLALALFALHAIVLWQLQSRLGLLAAAMLMLVGFVQGGGRPRVATWVLLALASAGAALWIWGLKSSHSLLVRLDLWKAAIAVFLDHPWTGVGPHNFVLAHAVHVASEVRSIDPRIAPWPHSLPLELAAETGLLGCCAFLVLLLSLSPQMLAGARGRAVGISGAIFLFLCLFEASTLRSWWWLLVGLALAASNREWMAVDASRNRVGSRDGANGLSERDTPAGGARRE
jgi:O-antigen ligase